MVANVDREEKSAAVVVGQELEIPLREVIMYKGQPRHFFDQQKVRTLGESIKTRGQITPLHVRRLLPEEQKKHQGKFWQAIDGQRRYMACECIKKPTIRAIIVAVNTEKEMFVSSVMANFHREPHPPLEVAQAIRHLKEDLGFSVTEIMSMIGCSDCYVYEYLHLFSLAPEIRNMMDPAIPEKERLPFMTAKKLATFPEEDQRKLIGLIAGLSTIKAKHVMEVYAAKHKINRSMNTGRWSPNKNWAILRGFITRLEEGTKIFTEKPPDYYDAMTEFRNIADIQRAMRAIKDCLGRLEKIKEFLAKREEMKRKGIPFPKPKIVPVKQETQGNGNGKKNPKEPPKPFVSPLTPGQIQDKRAHEEALRALENQEGIETTRALRWGGRKVEPEAKVELVPPGRKGFRSPLVDG